MSALIEAEGVSKSFGGLQALTECSLSVPKGSIAGPDRTQRVGQDHAVQRDDRL